MADEVRRGADPVAEARARRASVNAPKRHTLAELLDLYGRQAGANTKSWPAQMDPHVRRVFRAYLDVPLASLSVGALQMTIDDSPRPKICGVRGALLDARFALGGSARAHLRGSRFARSQGIRAEANPRPRAIM